MNPQSLIYDDVKEKYQELKYFIKRQSDIYDIPIRDLYKYLIVLSRKELDEK